MSYKHHDLTKRSDPNYDRLYREKLKESGEYKKYYKKYREKKKEEDPEYWSKRYDKEKARKYREENKAILMEKHWLSKGIVDMTYNKYLHELETQQRRCKICDKEMQLPHVDHDHNTGKYRGLLCVACNNGLGIYEKMKSKFEKYLQE
jgi:hypothetical protein